VRAAGKRPYLIGKRFGTIGMKVAGHLVEVTTFRNEKYISGSRKPQVSYVQDISADLSRRDFRINAIARRGSKLIDPYGGRVDLLEKKIKCVGVPKDRFKEDPLRMLRAARFASQLEFKVDEFLEDTVKKMSYKILEVSKERWVMEMDKLLMTDRPSIGLDFMARTRLLNFMIPELSLQINYDQNSPYHELDLWTHTMMVVRNCPKDIELRWSALLHDIAKPFVRTDRPDRSNYIKHDLLGAECVQRIGYYLKWSTARREMVSELVLKHLMNDSVLKQYDDMSKKVRG